jgi:hypothetical protein
MTPDPRVRASAARRFDRGSWFALGAVLSFMTLCAALSAYLLSLPGDGCLLDPTAESPVPVLDCVGDWPTPLQPGDLLLSVNGLSAVDVDSLGLARAPLPPNWHASGEAHYVVQRDAEVVRLAVPLGRLDTADVFRVLGTAHLWQFVGPILPVFLGSFVVFLLAPRVSAARLLFIGSGGLVAVGRFVWSAFSVPVIFQLAPAWALHSMIFLALIWGWLFIPSALLIVLSFPRRIWPLTRWPLGTSVLVYSLCVSISAFAVVTRNLGPYGALLTMSALVVVVGVVATTIYTFLRVHDPVVRAQTAWIALGLTAGFGFWPLSDLLPDITTGQSMWTNQLVQFGIGLIFPLSLGIAITRYHLFDIYFLIRRTLLYGVLSTMLAAIYIGSVLLLQRIVQPLTGSSSQLAIVASTLLIAALFGPLRNRLQRTIDRRFFRRRYDSQRTIQAFSNRLRNETDLTHVSADLQQVVQEALEPEHVSLWLRRHIRS